jgi:hypothetical protein
MTVTLEQRTVGYARPTLSLGTELVGLIILLLGVWAAIVPYVGPIFGYSADGSPSWTWNLGHSLLFLVPGVAAVVGGALVMISGRAVGSAGRGLLACGGLLAMLCGAWLVIGPLAWPALEGTAFYMVASPLSTLAHGVGYSLGPGALLLAMGGIATGRAVSARTVRPAPTGATSVAPPQSTVAGPRHARPAQAEEPAPPPPSASTVP